MVRRVQDLSKTAGFEISDRILLGATFDDPAGTDIDFVSFYPQNYRGVGSLESAGMVAELMAEIDRINAIVEGMLALARPADPVAAMVELAEALGAAD